MDIEAVACVINPESCIKCGHCELICPTEAIYYCAKCDPPTYVIDQQKCNCCEGYSDSPECLDICPLVPEAINCERCGQT